MRIAVFDLESNGFLDELDTIHCLVIQDAETGEKVSCAHDMDYRAIWDGLAILEKAEVLVGHNILSFDIPAIQKVYPNFRPKGIVRDTLILSRMLYGDIKDRDFEFKRRNPSFPGNLIGRHSLEAWGHRLKLFKGDYKGPWDEWSRDMQDYCEQDVAVTYRLWTMFQKKLPNNQECIEIEHEIRRIINRQENRGFAFDKEGASALYSKLVARRLELEEQLQAAFPPITKKIKFTPKATNSKYGYVKGVPTEKSFEIVFNPGSRQHIAQRLIDKYGWKPKEFTDGGQPKIDEPILDSLPYPEAKLLSEYFLIQKRLGMLAEGEEAWLKAERKGRIHGRVTTNGAVTGRMTHQRPNLAQVPSLRAKYGEECRKLFIAAPRHLLVGVDADALELRCLAGYMAHYDGGEYVKVVLQGNKEEGTDIHSVNCRALGLDPKVEYGFKHNPGTGRDVAKRWFYAFIYGAGDGKLGALLDGKSKDGAQSRAKFLKELPALGTLVDNVKSRAKKRGYVIGLDGRHIHIRSEHAALNSLLQSAGAILMKKAQIILDQSLQGKGLMPGRDYEFVATVHDEWQLEVLEQYAETVGGEATEAIRLAGVHFGFKCPLAGNYSIGRNWAETH